MLSEGVQHCSRHDVLCAWFPVRIGTSPLRPPHCCSVAQRREHPAGGGGGRGALDPREPLCPAQRCQLDDPASAGWRLDVSQTASAVHIPTPFPSHSLTPVTLTRLPSWDCCRRCRRRCRDSEADEFQDARSRRQSILSSPGSSACAQRLLLLLQSLAEPPPAALRIDLHAYSPAIHASPAPPPPPGHRPLGRRRRQRIFHAQARRRCPDRWVGRRVLVAKASRLAYVCSGLLLLARLPAWPSSPPPVHPLSLPQCPPAGPASTAIDLCWRLRGPALRASLAEVPPLPRSSSSTPCSPTSEDSSSSSQQHSSIAMNTRPRPCPTSSTAVDGRRRRQAVGLAGAR